MNTATMKNYQAALHSYFHDKRPLRVFLILLLQQYKSNNHFQAKKNRVSPVCLNYLSKDTLIPGPIVDVITRFLI